MNEKIYSNALKSSTKIIYARLIIFGAVILGLIGYILINYIVYNVNAPEITDSSKLSAYESGTILKITSDKFVYTGFYDEENEKITGYYYFINIDGTYITVRSKKDYTEEYPTQVHEFKGIIHSDMYYTENVELFAYWAEITEHQAKYHLLPYEITDDYQNDKLTLLLICIPAAVLSFIALGGLKKNRKNREALISYTDIDSAEASFDKEFNSENKFTCGKFTITPNWIFNRLSGDTYLLPTNEIVWIYKTITRHSTNGIPTGKTYSANFCFSDGTEHSFGSSQKHVDSIISYMEQNRPLTYVGFSDELKQQWHQNRKAFIEEWRNQGHTDIPFDYE